MSNRSSEGNGIGTRVPEGWYLRGETAKRVGRDKDTLKRWHKLGQKELDDKVPHPKYVGAIPSGKMTLGRLDVWLYTDEDIDNLKAIAGRRWVQKKHPA